MLYNCLVAAILNKWIIIIIIITVSYYCLYICIFCVLFNFFIFFILFYFIIIFLPWYFIPRVLKLANVKMYVRNLTMVTIIYYWREDDE